MVNLTIKTVLIANESRLHNYHINALIFPVFNMSLNQTALHLSKTRKQHQQLEELQHRGLQKSSLPAAKTMPNRLPRSPKRMLSLNLILTITPVSKPIHTHSACYCSARDLYQAPVAPQQKLNLVVFILFCHCRCCYH